ncbi:hypothetical protein TNCV_1745241 [Trichonephila clavipes]|nr:hypothetical protein TNCV_1745241 [Trichonephila clavipes]
MVTPSVGGSRYGILVLELIFNSSSHRVLNVTVNEAYRESIKLDQRPWVAYWLELWTLHRKAWFHASIVEVEIEGGAIHIVIFYRPLGNFAELNRTATCMVLKAKTNDRRKSSPL